MHPSEAREHLEMADRIVAASTRHLSLRYAGPYFIVWGLFAGWVDVSAQFAVDHILRPTTAGWLDLALLLVAIAWSAFYGIRGSNAKSPGVTFVQREFLKAMGITFALTFIAEWTGLFSGFSASAIWSIACAVVLFFIWAHGNWRAFACGAIVVLSMFVAGFSPSVEGYVLAAGLFVGYSGFGVVETLAG